MVRWIPLVLTLVAAAAIVARSRLAPGLAGSTTGRAGRLVLVVVLLSLAVIEYGSSHRSAAVGLLLLAAGTAVLTFWAWDRDSEPPTKYGLAVLGAVGAAGGLLGWDAVAASSVACLLVVWGLAWALDVAELKRRLVDGRRGAEQERERLLERHAAALAGLSAELDQARTDISIAEGARKRAQRAQTKADQDLREAIHQHDLAQKRLRDRVDELVAQRETEDLSHRQELQEAETSRAGLALDHESGRPLALLGRRVLENVLRLTGGTSVETSVEPVADAVSRTPAEVLAVARILEGRGEVTLSMPSVRDSLWSIRITLTHLGLQHASTR